MPALPTGFDLNVRTGIAITDSNWNTIGIVTLNDVRVGLPKIAAFDLTSNMLPPPANLGGNDHHCILALIHHADDQFINVETNTDILSTSERKAAHKNLKVVQFTGTIPTAAPLVIPIRINNASQKNLVADVVLKLFGYGGAIKLFFPNANDNEIKNNVEGLSLGKDYKEFREWARRHIRFIESNIKKSKKDSKPWYNEIWAKQLIDDIKKVLQQKVMFTVTDNNQIAVRNVELDYEEAGGYQTFFLVVDKPKKKNIGQAFESRYY